MKNITNKIIDKIMKTNFPQGERSVKFLNEKKKEFKKKLSNKNNYLSYEIDKGDITKLVFAEFNKNPPMLNCILIIAFHFNENLKTKKNIKIELTTIQKHFGPKKLKIFLGVLGEDINYFRLLKSVGFRHFAYRLKAKVIDSKKVLKKIRPPEGISTEYFNYNIDFNELLKVEYIAHRNEPTSVVHRLPKKYWKGFFKILKKSSMEKTAFVLKEKNKIIGFIAYQVSPMFISGAFVASISIHPKYQGKGISKYLYKLMIDDLSRRKIKYYHGYSSTSNVLRLAKKLKRKPYYFTFITEHHY